MSDNKKFSQKQQEYFNEVVSHQKEDNFFDENNATAVEYDTIMKTMKNLENKTVLDIGCGMGRYSLRIAKFAKEVVGVDISEKSIEFANKKASEYNISNFKGVVFDYNNPIQENYFDYILMVNVVHHIDDIDLVLRNLKTSLKKDGRLIIFEFNPLNLMFIPFLVFIKQLKSHINKFYFRSNIFTLRKIMKKNNFSITSFKRYAFLPTALYNASLIFKKINFLLNKTPIINIFSAFHILECKKQTNEDE